MKCQGNKKLKSSPGQSLFVDSTSETYKNYSDRSSLEYKFEMMRCLLCAAQMILRVCNEMH